LDRNPIRNAVYFASQADNDCVTGGQRPVWDQLAIMYGAWGAAFGDTTYFHRSAAVANVVNASDGTNSWSSKANSGHYYFMSNASPEAFADLLDGYAHNGLLAADRLVSNGIIKP
jgi:hypothetical protein